MNYKQMMHYAMNLIDKVCPVCGEDFQTTKEDQVFCSVSCASSRPRQRKSLICSICGRPVRPRDRYTSGRKSYKAVFCSKDCYTKAGYGKSGRPPLAQD